MSLAALLAASRGQTRPGQSRSAPDAKPLMPVRRHLLVLLLGLPLTFGRAARSDAERARSEYERQQRKYRRAHEQAHQP